MDFGTLLFLGFLWFVFNLLRKGGAAGSAPRTPPQSRPQQTSLPEPGLGQARPGVDATQREGTRLEALLRDLNRNLDEAARTGKNAKAGVGAAAEDAATGDEFEEESESLEVAPDTVSLETEALRTRRVMVDQDDLASQVAEKRIKAAEARSTARTPVDHRKFDERIRREPADHTAAKTYTPQQLREAVVWRELLGPPVALRDDEPNPSSRQR